MVDLFDLLADMSYFGIFLILFAINASPILMPPSWIVLVSFYSLDSSMSPLVLSLVGACASVVGRSVLLYASRHFGRFIGNERRGHLERLRQYLAKKRFGFLLASFVFALSPLPSNLLFIAYGLMKAKNIGLFIGFWVGRVASFYVMIKVSTVALKPFLELFEDNLTGIIVTDIVVVLMLVGFASINWEKLITEKKLSFVKPKLWRI